MSARPYLSRPGSGYRVIPVARAQRQIGDWLEAAAARHTMHGLMELDVTDARGAIRARRARDGEPLSFTAFLVACLARALEEHPVLHAHRLGSGRLVMFDEVDVTVAIERTVEGDRIPVPHIVRRANARRRRRSAGSSSAAQGPTFPTRPLDGSFPCGSSYPASYGAPSGRACSRILGGASG